MAPKLLNQLPLEHWGNCPTCFAPGVIGMPCHECHNGLWGDNGVKDHETHRNVDAALISHFTWIKDDGNCLIEPFRLSSYVGAPFMDYHLANETSRWPLDERSRPRGLTEKEMLTRSGRHKKDPKFPHFLNHWNVRASVCNGSHRIAPP